jgi:hypothetical protein
VLLITEAVHTSPQAWQTVAFVGAILGFIAAGVPLFASVGLPTARRFYWGGCLTAAALGAVTVSPRGWQACIAVIGLVVFLFALRAYFATPYIKINGRIIAHSIPDTLAEEPEDSVAAQQESAADSYSGLATAPKQWWVFAGLACLLGGAVYTLGWDWRGIFAVVFLSFLGAVTGHDDSSRQLPVARGQKLQAFLVLVATIPMFVIPPIAYLVGYEIGKHRPHQRSRHDR